MLKKILLILLPIFLLAAGCTHTQTSTDSSIQTSLTETYKNSKYHYSIKYPLGYTVETFETTDTGEILPLTTAKPDSDIITINKNHEESWVSIEIFENIIPLTEENIKKSYAVQPENVTKTNISNMSGYKVTFPEESKISYEIYYLNDNKIRYQIKIKRNDSLSEQMLNTFQITQQ